MKKASLLCIYFNVTLNPRLTSEDVTIRPVLHQDPGRSWTIAKLAAEVGMSRSPFATKFTSFVGEPPLSYLTHLRLNLAAGYLQSGQLRIGEIAERVGYESQGSFSNAFKRQFAMSPREYKEKHRST